MNRRHAHVIYTFFFFFLFFFFFFFFVVVVVVVVTAEKLFFSVENLCLLSKHGKQVKSSQVKSSIVYLCLTSVYIKTYLTYKTHIYIYDCHSKRIARDNKSYRFQVYTV